MKIRAVGVFSFVLAVTSWTLFGCSDEPKAVDDAASGTCPAVGTQTCPNESVDQANFNFCTNAKADKKCGTAFTNQLKCAGANVTCGSDGLINRTKLESACKSQVEAYNKCIGAGAQDAGTD